MVYKKIVVRCNIDDFYALSLYAEKNGTSINDVVIAAIEKQLQQEINLSSIPRIMGRSKRVVVRIPYYVNRKLKEYSKKYGITVNKVVRVAIKNFLDEVKSEIKKDDISNEIEKKRLVVVTIKIPDDLYEKLAYVAIKNDMNVSEAIREAIKRMLKNDVSQYRKS